MIVLLIVLWVLVGVAYLACVLVDEGRRVDRLVEDVRRRSPGLLLAPAAMAGPGDLAGRALLGVVALAFVALVVGAVLVWDMARDRPARHANDDHATHLTKDQPPAPDQWERPS